jgi:ribosomal protein S18 acetylase RimI-like enzyme
MDITIKPLTPDLLKDYLYFFDHTTFCENPDWSICYCFSYHFTGTKEQWNKDENRSSVIKYINERRMSGYLAFSGEKPVGWCNANNRLNYERLVKNFDLIDNPEDKVCSIVCFLVNADSRRQGIAQGILEKICQDCSDQGFDYIEAYPGKGKLSSEGHFKGPLELYEKFGFKIIKELNDFFVVRKNLK